ncbi:hypothetical protein VTN00DRAFT_8195 [Thermoascus crustaceus]|uniref:uncharacterized protein n=1 Tax=Thermoascus crustaceus TaxID=5088 RepID=UPI0037427835
MRVSSAPSEASSTVTTSDYLLDSPVRELPRENNTNHHTAASKRASRFYSTPLDANIPDSTPVHLYGYERREPSVLKVRTGFFNRISGALDDLKEDFPLSPRAWSWKNKRSSTSEGAESRTPTEPSSSRPLSMASVLSLDTFFATTTPAPKPPNRRFSTLGFSSSLHSLKDKRPRSFRLRRNSHPNPVSASQRDEGEVR